MQQVSVHNRFAWRNSKLSLGHLRGNQFVCQTAARPPALDNSNKSAIGGQSALAVPITMPGAPQNQCSSFTLRDKWQSRYNMMPQDQTV
mmetsp:Transcript_21607/g.45270  ORF Transcript_21607/g.45270 Transcript_21607/m.45270 type:complete len:89 (-) Transcript_21607:79-345(-)